MERLPEEMSGWGNDVASCAVQLYPNYGKHGNVDVSLTASNLQESTYVWATVTDPYASST